MRMVELFCAGERSFDVAQIMKKEFNYPFTKNGILGAMHRWCGCSVYEFLRSYIADWKHDKDLDLTELEKIFNRRYATKIRRDAMKEKTK